VACNFLYKQLGAIVIKTDCKLRLFFLPSTLCDTLPNDLSNGSIFRKMDQDLQCNPGVL